jgi:hypothetical protein
VPALFINPELQYVRIVEWSPYINILWCKSSESCAEDCAQGLGASSYPNESSCIIPKGIKDTRLPSNQSFWQGLKDSWTDDGCRYPYAYEGLVSLMVVLPVLLICMVVIGIVLRQLARSKLHDNQESISAIPIPPWLRNTLSYSTLAISMARPIFVCADIVTDCMAIAQVWGSWVGYVMLGVVFVPNLVAATVMAICLWVCGPSKMLEQQAGSNLNQQQCFAAEACERGCNNPKAAGAQGSTALLLKVQL